MTIALDHIFIITEPEAEKATRLLEIGFVEGNANVHAGQGTSNRRFFLDGFTIEFLYVSNADEAANGAGKGLGILARSRDVQTSPFGIVVRVQEATAIPSFPSWKYYPDYFGGKMCFYVGDNSSQLQEPLCICMPPSLPAASKVAKEYANPDWCLTGLEISVPVEKPSETLQHFAAIDRVDIQYGQPHRMTMEFNNGVTGRIEDFTPDLPMVLRW